MKKNYDQFEEARKKALAELAQQGNYCPTAREIATQILFVDNPNCQQWEQQGIEGFAPNVTVEELENKPIIRQRLDYYIRNVFCTTKKDFANLLGVSPATITKWLHSTATPKIPFMRKIAKQTGVPYNEILWLFEEGL